MLNLHIKCVILSCEVIWINKTCGNYLSRHKNAKADTYVLQQKYDLKKWAKMNNYPVKTERVNTKQNHGENKIYKSPQMLFLSLINKNKKIKIVMTRKKY